MIGGNAYLLVGYDGSPGSVAALRWAAAEARRRRLGITVCHVWHWPYAVESAGSDARAAVRRMAEETSAAGAAVVSAYAPQLAVQARTVSGPTAETLLAMGRDADCIVVGDGGAGLADLPMGSVAGQVAAYADRPVIVVRGPIDRSGIVAGVDGSVASDAVLAFALEEAMLRRVPLTAVCSWRDTGAVPAGSVVETEVVREKAAARFEHLLTLWQEKYIHVAVQASLVAEPPRTALLAAALDAGLLVVGRRGLGAAPRPLGSVGQTAIRHASCPVAVVSGT